MKRILLILALMAPAAWARFAITPRAAIFVPAAEESSLRRAARDRAAVAHRHGDQPATAAALRDALAAFAEVRAGQALAARGDRKMDLAAAGLPTRRAAERFPGVTK